MAGVNFELQSRSNWLRDAEGSTGNQSGNARRVVSHIQDEVETLLHRPCQIPPAGKYRKWSDIGLQNLFSPSRYPLSHVSSWPNLSSDCWCGLPTDSAELSSEHQPLLPLTLHSVRQSQLSQAKSAKWFRLHAETGIDWWAVPRDAPVLAPWKDSLSTIHSPYNVVKRIRHPMALFRPLPYTPQNVNRGKWGRLVDLSLITSIGFIPNRPVDGYPVTVAVRVKGAGSRIDSQFLRRQWWLGSQPLTSGHFMFYIYIYTYNHHVHWFSTLKLLFSAYAPFGSFLKMEDPKLPKINGYPMIKTPPLHLHELNIPIGMFLLPQRSWYPVGTDTRWIHDAIQIYIDAIYISEIWIFAYVLCACVSVGFILCIYRYIWVCMWNKFRHVEHTDTHMTFRQNTCNTHQVHHDMYIYMYINTYVTYYTYYTSSTAQGGGGSFKNWKPIGEIGCCESGMAERIHWWTERCLRSPLFLSLSLTIYPPTNLYSMYLSIYLSIHLSIFLIYLSFFLSF